ncbi:hypothetical protein [Sneathiella sp.]|jgi:hypothetical protein|uniref:hypothetical protein n=1 Tax=Sneathiella sp. TaxID=1964365 RepID=UPI0039E50268
MRGTLDLFHLKIGFLWLLTGVTFGTWMGITENFQYANAHAHVGLLGFVLPVMFGILLKLYGRLKQAALSVLQFFVFHIGAATLIAGKVIVTKSPELFQVAAVGSIITILGVFLFLVMVFGLKHKHIE